MTWLQRIKATAEATPETRYRSIDLYRAMAIVLVVLGHWLGAAVWVGQDGTLNFNNILALDNSTHWITWIVQVMPVFFVVGGYSNWRSREKAGEGSSTADWIGVRARRLITPVGPLVLFVSLLVVVTLAAGVDVGIVRGGSWNAVVPLWFLAVYLLIVSLTTVTVKLWRIGRWWTVGLGVCLAFAVDGLRAATSQDWIGWINFIVIWGTVHQAGYGWATEDRPPRKAGLYLLLATAVGLMVGLAVFGPYPVSMVAVPGAPQNNTLPPTAMMAVIAAAQYALLRLFEPFAQRAARKDRTWLAVVGLHAVMMTTYIWHLTALALVVLLGYAVGVGFSVEPLTWAWWISRPLWILVLVVALAVLIAIFGRFEHAIRATPPPRPWALAIGILATVAAISFAATEGLVDESGSLAWPTVVMFAVGIGALGAWPRLWRR